MTRSRRSGTAAIGWLVGAVYLIIGLVPVAFLDWDGVEAASAS
jgi:hypothetical protein